MPGLCMRPMADLSGVTQSTSGSAACCSSPPPRDRWAGAGRRLGASSDRTRTSTPVYQHHYEPQMSEDVLFTGLWRRNCVGWQGRTLPPGCQVYQRPADRCLQRRRARTLRRRRRSIGSMAGVHRPIHGALGLWDHVEERRGEPSEQSLTRVLYRLVSPTSSPPAAPLRRHQDPSRAA